MEEFRIGEHFAENFKGMAPKEVKDNLEGICYLESVDGAEKIDEITIDLINKEVEKIKEATTVIFY